MRRTGLYVGYLVPWVLYISFKRITVEWDPNALAVALVLSLKTAQTDSLQKDLRWPGYATSKSGVPPDLHPSELRFGMMNLCAGFRKGLPTEEMGEQWSQPGKEGEAHLRHCRMIKRVSYVGSRTKSRNRWLVSVTCMAPPLLYCVSPLYYVCY